MPFTLAHPAAAIPLVRPLRRYGLLSALVIGSIAPDLSYVLAIRGLHPATHSLPGLFWFCLPAGLLSYGLFHVVLKGPLLGLLPDWALHRLGRFTAHYQSLPAVSWRTVIASLTCGALSHIAWDAFTHQRGPAVILFPVLQFHLFSVGGYHVYLYTLLQHASSVVGIALISWWSWRWLKAAPVSPYSLPVMLSQPARLTVVALIAGVSAAFGCINGASACGEQAGMLAMQAFAAKAFTSAIPAFVFLAVVYSIAWHLRRLGRKTS